jgi:hypothetical protein
VLARCQTIRMRPLTLAVLWLGAVVGTSSCGATAASAIRPLVSPIVEFSHGCAGQNAEVEQAVDPARGYVYEEWMGCNNQIGFAASADGGQHFGKPVVLAGNGTRWSPPLRVTPDTDDAAHIVEVADGRRGVAYVGWLADNSPSGYALYLRQFSITRGWLTPPIQVSQSYGDASIWPGDTFGISTEPGLDAGPQAGWPRVVVSWGSAVGVAGLAAVSQDRATVVTWPPAGS